MSALSALSGEHPGPHLSGSGAVWLSSSNALIAVRNAASVLPEPVGAAMSVCRPAAIASQPRNCADVGSPTSAVNH